MERRIIYGGRGREKFDEKKGRGMEVYMKIGCTSV